MGDQVVGLVGDLALNPRSLEMLKALLGVGNCFILGDIQEWAGLEIVLWLAKTMCLSIGKGRRPTGEPRGRFYRNYQGSVGMRTGKGL